MTFFERAKEYRLSEFLKGKDFVSLANILFGLYSIYFVIQGEFVLASILLILAFVADILDGKVARFLSQSNEFGKRMDMADLISFGAAPAIFILVLYQGSSFYPNLFLHISAICLVSAALFRLARFQTKDSDIEGFIGVPTTTNGIIYPILYFLGAGQYTVIIITFVMAFLMMSSIVIPIKD